MTTSLASPRHGVGREGDAGGVGLHHGLHEHRHAGGAVLARALCASLPVGGHPRGGGGVEDPLDRPGQAFEAYVQEGLVLPGERGAFEVLGGAGGADREPLGAQRGRGLQ